MIAKILRFSFALIIIAFFGFFGIIFFFADYGVGETAVSRMLWAILYYFLLGSVIGALSTPFWKLSGILAWGVIILSLFGIVSSIFDGLFIDVLQGLSTLILPLLAALLGGKLGNIWLIETREKFPKFWKKIKSFT